MSKTITTKVFMEYAPSGKGRITKMIECLPSGDTLSHEFEYTDGAPRIEKTKVYENNKYKYMTERHYLNEKEVYCLYESASHEISENWYEYNEKGDLISHMSTSHENDFKTDITYDERGNKTKMVKTIFHPYGNDTETIERSYDNFSNCTEEVTISCLLQ